MGLTIASVFTKCESLQLQLPPLHGVFVPLTFAYHSEYIDPNENDPGSDVTVDIVQKTTLRYIPMHTVRTGGNQVSMAPPTVVGTFNSIASIQAQGIGGDVPISGIHLSVAGGLPFDPAFANIVLQCTDVVIMQFNQTYDPTLSPVEIDEKSNPHLAASSTTSVILDFDTPLILRTDIIRQIPSLSKGFINGKLAALSKQANTRLTKQGKRNKSARLS